MSDHPIDPGGLFAALYEGGIDYVLIGAFAAVLHGSPLLTMDLDICPRDNEETLAKLAAMLMTDGLAKWSRTGTPLAPTHQEAIDRLREVEIANLATRFGRVDVIKEPSGTQGFADLNRDAVTLDIGGIPVRVASLRDIIRSKQASGRETDLAQLPVLRKLLERTD